MNRLIELVQQLGGQDEDGKYCYCKNRHTGWPHQEICIEINKALITADYELQVQDDRDNFPSEINYD